MNINFKVINLMVWPDSESNWRQQLQKQTLHLLVMEFSRQVSGLETHFSKSRSGLGHGFELQVLILSLDLVKL